MKMICIIQRSRPLLGGTSSGVTAGCSNLKRKLLLSSSPYHTTTSTTTNSFLLFMTQPSSPTTVPQQPSSTTRRTTTTIGYYSNSKSLIHNNKNQNHNPYNDPSKCYNSNFCRRNSSTYSNITTTAQRYITTTSSLLLSSSSDHPTNNKNEIIQQEETTTLTTSSVTAATPTTTVDDGASASANIVVHHESLPTTTTTTTTAVAATPTSNKQKRKPKTTTTTTTTTTDSNSSLSSKKSTSTIKKPKKTYQNKNTTTIQKANTTTAVSVSSSSSSSSQQQPSSNTDEVPLYLVEGCFAVYKPLLWSSSDVVVYIRNMLERDALERGCIFTKFDHKRNTTSKNRFKHKKSHHDKLSLPLPPPTIKVGHGGTLDPLATGVLIIGIGNGTKELTELLSGKKKYIAEGEFGFETNTLDMDTTTGFVTRTGSYEHITLESIQNIIPNFIGSIQQIPPVFSALKKKGKTMYKEARKVGMITQQPQQVQDPNENTQSSDNSSSSDSSISSSSDSSISSDSSTNTATATATTLMEFEKLESTMTPRTVEIQHLKLLLDDNDNDEINHSNDTNDMIDDNKKNDVITKKTCPPHFKIEVECGGGTYIRSLIRDMGRTLNSYATMKSLVRTQQSTYHIENALVKDDWSPTTIYNTIEKCNQEKEENEKNKTKE